MTLIRDTHQREGMIWTAKPKKKAATKIVAALSELV